MKMLLCKLCLVTWFSLFLELKYLILPTHQYVIFINLDIHLYILQLYDLMTMAFKFQVSLSLRPRDIILITLNHIDAIKKLLDGAPNIQQQVDHVYRLLIDVCI